MASLSFPLNCGEHRGSLGVEPRGGVRGSPVEMLCWPTHPQGLGTLSRHSPSPALSPLHAQTGKRQRGIRAASLSLAQSQGSKSRAGAAAEGWETSRTKVHTSHMLTGHFRSRAGGFHCQHGAWQGWGWHSAGAEPLRAQGRARIVNRATEPQSHRETEPAPPELPAAGGGPKTPTTGVPGATGGCGDPTAVPHPLGSPGDAPSRGMLHPGRLSCSLAFPRSLSEQTAPKRSGRKAPGASPRPGAALGSRGGCVCNSSTNRFTAEKLLFK